MPTKCLVDSESGHLREHVYYLTNIYHVGDYVIRIRIRRDTYDPQSYALAEILNNDNKWTDLVSTPTEKWEPGSPLRLTEGGEELLHSVADSLFDRACTVLKVDRR